MSDERGCTWAPRLEAPEDEPYPSPPCDRQAAAAGLCIFHLPKTKGDPLWETLSETDQRHVTWAGGQFTAAFDEVLAEMRGRPSSEPRDLRGYRFPQMTFKEEMFQRPVLMDEAVIAPHSDLSKVTIREGSSFRGVEFGELCLLIDLKVGPECSFEGAQFGTGTNLASAVFGDSCVFADVQFGQECNLRDVQFGKETRFYNLVAKDSCTLDGTQFGAMCRFDDARFGNLTTFEKTTSKVSFGDECSFTSASFGRECSFEWATFGDRCSFERATLGDGCSFFSAIFGEYCSFEGARLGARCSFDAATFGKLGQFAGTQFGNKCSFVVATLSEGSNFEGAKFQNDCTFDKATIREAGRFSGATFGERAIFTNVTFGERCSFDGATFGACSTFARATLADGCSFESARIEADADFNRLRVNGRVVFDGSDSVTAGTFQGAAWFTNISYGKDGVLEFRQTDLRRVSFLGTDISKAVFDDVRWPRYEAEVTHRRRNWTSLNRVCLWDELRIRANDGRTIKKDLAGQTANPLVRRSYYERVVANYRQLVVNLEARRSYEDAEDFYVGEMECRRKQLGVDHGRLIGGWLNVYGSYRLLSEYGSNLSRAILVLGLFTFVVFPIGFMLAGFDIAKDALPASAPQSTPPALVDWDWVWPPAVPDGTAVERWLMDYGSAIRLTLSIVSFQRDRFFVPTTGPGQAWLMLAFFVLTGQLALVLFALRRRLRR